MSPLDLMIGGLAVWRASAMLAYERGPFRVFTRFREAIGIEHFDDGTPDVDHLSGELGKLVACVWCSSVYLSVVWLVGVSAWHEVTMLVSTALALSSLAVLSERMARG